LLLQLVVLRDLICNRFLLLKIPPPPPPPEAAAASSSSTTNYPNLICNFLTLLLLLLLLLLLQGQRLLQLQTTVPVEDFFGAYTVTATAPPSAVIAPSAYYMLFAVSQGIPSQASWVQVN